MAKWVYKFEEGNASMRNLLGGKGCNLAEMTILGMPIPQGFTVTTEACTEWKTDHTGNSGSDFRSYHMVRGTERQEVRRH